MRSKLILFAAIVMGLITTYLFFGYMKKFDEVSTAGETLVEVVAAKQPIAKNQKIVPGMLEMRQVPQLGLHPDAVKTAAEAEGRLAAADIAAGEVLLKHRVKSPQDEAMFVSRKVQEGYRAVSVGVNFVQSVSNLIEPEDYVDVVLTTSDKTANAPVVSTLLLEKVRVLAIGRRMTEADKDTPYAEYSAVTLELKPQDAVTVVNADEKGTVTLALHSKANAAPANK